jgi:hypothetical protein
MGKPRVIISTDIGGADPDDMESMAHALIYADKLDIKGIISTPTRHDGRTSDIFKALDAYAKDYNNLKTWGDYPAPSYLKSVVYQGNVNVAPAAGYSSPTAGSQAIIKAAHQASAADPLYVMAWGGMTDIAQALHDDPSIAGKIRILSSNGWNGTQDPHSRDYIYNNFKDVWWIESKSTHRGIYVNSSGAEGNPFNMNEAKGHGALGDYFFNARPWGVKMGDSWSIAYLVDQVNNSNPGDNSWGGTFVKNGHGPYFWTDDPNPANQVGQYKGAAHVREHQTAIYQDMYKQFDKAKAPKPGTTNPDDPVVARNDSASTEKNKAVVIKVLQNDSAADGGLKLAGVDATSAKGGKVVLNKDGTVTYTPKAGYTGSDSFKYTAKDADGDSASATVSVTIKAPGVASSQSGGGKGNGVVANNDAYTVDPGGKFYFNTKYLLLNDKGADGGLKISIGNTSADGVKLEKWSDGTVVYKPDAGNVSDRIDYVLTDKDGSKDVGSVLLTIKNGAATPTPAPSKPSSGSVSANNDKYSVDSGETLYFNSRFLTDNDTGKGNLNVVSVSAVSERGVKVSWGPEGSAADGTVVYEAPSGFKGTDKLHYTVVDQSGGRDVGTILINVDPFNM